MLDSRLRGNDKSPLFVSVLAFFRKYEFITTGNPLFIRLSDPLQECPFNARRVPLRGPQFSKKGNYDPFFGLFLPPPNYETLINSHF
jgi:hypothetical protein